MEETLQLPIVQVGQKISQEFISTMRNELVDNPSYIIGDINAVINTDLTLHINGKCCIDGYTIELTNATVSLNDLVELNNFKPKFILLILDKEHLEDLDEKFKGISIESSDTPFIADYPYLIIGYVTKVDEIYSFVKIKNQPISANNMILDGNVLNQTNIFENITDPLSLNDIFEDNHLILDDGRIKESEVGNVYVSELPHILGGDNA